MFCRNCLNDHMRDETCEGVTVNEFGEPITLAEDTPWHLERRALERRILRELLDLYLDPQEG